MRCIVTAGPTWEPLDRVRRLTNFSTGSLGGSLGNALAMAGHEVLLLLSESATWRQPLDAVQTRPFSTTQSLADTLQSLATDGPVAVFHAAAVSDFAVGRVESRTPEGIAGPVSGGKVDSRGGSLWAELIPTPKILPQLRGWFPRGTITGWKYEVDGTEAEALARGNDQIAAARSNACVVNGPACGARWVWLRASQPPRSFDSRAALLQALVGATVATGKVSDVRKPDPANPG